MANVMKKVIVSDLNNNDVMVMLFMVAEKVAHVRCADLRLERFLTLLISNITEDNLAEIAEYFFREKSTKVDELAENWLKKHGVSAAVAEKTRSRVAERPKFMRPFDRLVYILGHYKACRGVQLHVRETKTQVILRLSVARMSESADITNGDVPLAKDKAAEKLLKRLGF